MKFKKFIYIILKASKFNDIFTEAKLERLKSLDTQELRVEGMLRKLTVNAVKVERLYKVLFELRLDTAYRLLDNEGFYYL